MVQNAKLAPSLSRSMRDCFLGRRGQSRDPFLGLEIHIRQGSEGDGYRADLEVADWREFPDLPVTLDLKHLRSIESDVNAYGLALGHALFADDACGSAYHEILAVARSSGQGVRVRLVLDPPELHEVHWERIFHPFAESWQPLGSTAVTPFSRYVAVRQWDRPAPVDNRPVRMLVVISSPADLEDWGLNVIEPEERSDLHALFDSLRDVKPVYLESGSALPPTLNEIRKAVAEGCDLVHFLCHGGHTQGGTVLYLEDEGGNVDPVTSERLVDMIRVVSAQPVCVFLAACESAARTRFDALAPLGPALVDVGGVHAAVAMTERVGIETAQSFTAQFYRRLLEHGRIDQAVNEARAFVIDEWDWGVPVLFMRVPDGRLLSEKNPVWCMPLRVGLIVLTLVLLGAVAAYPLARPWINPTQMDGEYKIAIADFGRISADGRVHEWRIGSTLSKTIYTQLSNEYAATYAELVGDDANVVQIWHDSLGPDVKNVKFGMIRGSTPEARAQRAQRLAQRINADIVIYGNIMDSLPETTAAGLPVVRARESAERQPFPDFQLEFYNRSETWQGEPDAFTGRHLVGEPIELPIDYAAEPLATVELLKQPLSQRTAAMFWITVALTYDLIGRQEDALDVMLTAQERLADWDDNNGQALLDYFTGREAYWLREYALALDSLNEAIHLNPEYANAYITRSATYYDKAQLFYITQPVPEDLISCVRTEHLARAAQSQQEALDLIDLAAASIDQAIDIAPDAPWPPIASVAHLVRANVYRLKGQAHLLAEEHEEAASWFEDALSELDIAEKSFQDQDQEQYLAWTQLARGATYYLQAFIHIAAARAEESKQESELLQATDLFQQAAVEYRSCIEIGQRVFDVTFREKVVDCGCRFYLSEAEKAQTQVETFVKGK